MNSTLGVVYPWDLTSESVTITKLVIALKSLLVVLMFAFFYNFNLDLLVLVIFDRNYAVSTKLSVPEPDDFKEEKFEPHNHEYDQELTRNIHVLLSIAIVKVSVESFII